MSFFSQFNAELLKILCALVDDYILENQLLLSLNVLDLFIYLRAPSIIVIDDIDVLCPKRSQNHTGQQEHRIVGTLISLIDSLSLVVRLIQDCLCLC